MRRLRQAAPAEPAKHRDEPESPSPRVEGRLSEVRPLAHDDDESPSREDRGYGHNAFDIPCRYRGSCGEASAVVAEDSDTG